LPDESKREIIGRNLGISARNDFAMLERIGGECAECFELVRAASSTPVLDLQALLNAVIFNWLIGNNDAHGKNFSLVYRGEMSSGLQTRLSPLYDLISTVYYPELSPKMAMKLGDEYLSERIAPANFERFDSAKDASVRVWPSPPLDSNGR
jgi:serine/threonine-protein kinase HipA